MIITKYFARAEEVISCGPCYKALYNALAHAYVEGIDNTVYLTEERAPLVTMCNCVKSVVKYLSGARRSSKMVFAMLNDLCVDDEGKNIDPASIPGESYLFFIPSFVERTVILAAVYLLLEETISLTQSQIKRLHAHLQAAHFSKVHFELFYARLQDELMRIQADPSYDGYAGHFRPQRHKEETGVSVDALFDVASTLCRNHPESVKVVLDVITTTIAQELGNDVQKAEARSHQLEESLAAAVNAAGKAFAAPMVTRKDMATTSQQSLVFFYLFHALGINFHNSDKAAWIRFIKWFTGKNQDSIKDHLKFDFESKAVQKDLQIVQAYVRELFPAISRIIENDRKA
ncbi:MAG: hypothetical protein IJV32_02005 [Bacteroidales bacterium]|nr:hypothetical protein [Bacteroidales bacterium]